MGQLHPFWQESSLWLVIISLIDIVNVVLKASLTLFWKIELFSIILRATSL